MAIDVCAITGGSTYVNSWLGINLTVILISILAGAVIFSLSKIMPSRFSAKVKSAVQSEITQAFIGAIIIMILLALSSTACNISTSMSQQLAQTSLNPFQYADYYIGNLSTNTGLGMLSKVYTFSIEYAIQSTILDSTYGSFLNNFFDGYVYEGPFMSIKFAPVFSLGKVMKIISDTYLAVFSSLLIIIVGMLFIQWLMIPVLEYTAFTVILPVALVMRSFGFVGGNLRNTANAFLAIAIAAYLVYPLMVAFDAYAINWIFSTSNPTYQYLKFETNLPAYNTATFFSQMPSQSLISGNPATATSFTDSYLASASITLNPLVALGSTLSATYTAPYTTDTLTSEMAKLLFVGVFMFAINIAVTAGLAMGITKGLNSGVEGASQFWGSL
ncbi:MAG: hypothetical protein ACP5RM_00730 [Candidatus Micrarchaeia archaeon]